MIELSTLQAVREIVTIVGVIAGLSYYFLTVQNANKARKIQLINRSAQYGQNMELSIISLELLEMQWEDYDDFVRKYDSTVNHDNYAKRNMVFSGMREIGFELAEDVVDIETVYKMLDGGHGQIQMWNKFWPIFMKQREVYNDPTRYQWFEYLVTELIKERVRRGRPREIIDVDGYWTQ
jgi:hypothetical protein